MAAVLFGAKFCTFFVLVVYVELTLMRRWKDQLDKIKFEDNFLSLIDITPFLTGKIDNELLHKIFGPNRVIKILFFYSVKITKNTILRIVFYIILTS
jgi:hypothetical protein